MILTCNSDFKDGSWLANEILNNLVQYFEEDSEIIYLWGNDFFTALSLYLISHYYSNSFNEIDLDKYDKMAFKIKKKFINSKKGVFDNKSYCLYKFAKVLISDANVELMIKDCIEFLYYYIENYRSLKMSKMRMYELYLNDESKYPCLIESSALLTINEELLSRLFKCAIRRLWCLGIDVRRLTEEKFPDLDDELFHTAFLGEDESSEELDIGLSWIPKIEHSSDPISEFQLMEEEILESAAEGLYEMVDNLYQIFQFKLEAPTFERLLIGHILGYWDPEIWERELLELPEYIHHIAMYFYHKSFELESDKEGNTALLIAERSEKFSRDISTKDFINDRIRSLEKRGDIAVLNMLAFDLVIEFEKSLREKTNYCLCKWGGDDWPEKIKWPLVENDKEDNKEKKEKKDIKKGIVDLAVKSFRLQADSLSSKDNRTINWLNYSTLNELFRIIKDNYSTCFEELMFNGSNDNYKKFKGGMKDITERYRNEIMHSRPIDDKKQYVQLNELVKKLGSSPF